MFNERIPTKQLTTWLCGAILPVWIQLSAGEAWLTVAVTAVLSIAAVWAVWRWGRFESKVLLGLSILFQVLLLGTLMPYAARVWPGGNQYPAVPLGILILSVWSAWKGPRAAAAVGCVLFWAVLVGNLVILGAGISGMELQWLRPAWSTPEPLVIILGLVPSAAAIWKSNYARWSVKFMLPAVVTVLVCVVTVGVLSPKLAGETGNGYLELSRSVSVFGIARHFEAVGSAIMTAGWFLIVTLMLSLCASQAERIGIKKARHVILVCGIAAALWMLCEMHMSQEFLLVFGPVCWVFAPLLPQGIEPKKKS